MYGLKHNLVAWYDIYRGPQFDFLQAAIPFFSYHGGENNFGYNGSQALIDPHRAARVEYLTNRFTGFVVIVRVSQSPVACFRSS